MVHMMACMGVVTIVTKLNHVHSIHIDSVGEMFKILFGMLDLIEERIKYLSLTKLFMWITSVSKGTNFTIPGHDNSWLIFMHRAYF